MLKLESTTAIGHQLCTACDPSYSSHSLVLLVERINRSNSIILSQQISRYVLSTSLCEAPVHPHGRAVHTTCYVTLLGRYQARRVGVATDHLSGILFMI